MACAQTMRVTAIVFNGITHTPINKTAMIKLGGWTATDGVMDNAGRRFSPEEMLGGEVEFDFPNTEEFDPANYQGICSDLQFTTSVGKSYLMTGAKLTSTLEIKDSEPSVKLSFKGDSVVAY